MPYHIDNVSIDGSLTPAPINYTFSGSKGEEGSGEMSVSYTRKESTADIRDLKFNTAATTETIAILGDAGPYVQGYLSLHTMGANHSRKL